MTYDFHGQWDGRTGHNAPMYVRSSDTNKEFNIDASITAWINAGASPKKLLLGLAFYGHTFRLANTGNNGIGATASGAGTPGPYSKAPGSLTYLEVCKEFAKGGWKKFYDKKQKSPYAVKGDQWLSYDHVNSIKAKAQYAIDKGLGGVMIWAVDQDDRMNICGSGEMPLMNAIVSVLGR